MQWYDLPCLVRQNLIMETNAAIAHEAAGADLKTEFQTPQITLKSPSESYIDSFFDAMAEFKAEGDDQFLQSITRDQFPLHVQRLHDLATDINLKEGYIPSKEFWIMDAEGFAGRIILGLTFIPSPERVGHHVGYAIRSSKRLNGYATKALQLLCDEARKLRIFKLMPTCGADNVASRRVIEKNGGVLLDKSGDELRYLIDLDPN
jgi:predicted acetyltransferase